MPYLILQDVTATNDNGDSFVHQAGTVVSDFEVSEFVRNKISEGSAWYRAHFEPLTDEEAKHHRAKATVAEGDHAYGGEVYSPPWEDYVGLHPEEIIERLRKCKTSAEVEQIKNYERGGLNRTLIVDFLAPVEREPFQGYDDMHVREVLEKLAVLSEPAVHEVITYESAHRRRPAIISYERELYESSGEAEPEPVTAGVGQQEA